MTRLLASLTLAIVVLALGTTSLRAQQPDTTAAPAVEAEGTRGQGQGQTALTDWPASLSQLLGEMGEKAPYLLPKIDSLGLDYRYAANDSTSQWSFVLGWTPGDRVLYEGEVLPRRRAPSGLRMANVELRAEIQVDGEYVGDMIVAVDSMALAPFPSVYSFEVEVSHGRVLLDAPAETARRALLEGATLSNLVVERMGFVSEAASTSERRTDPDVRERRPGPRSPPSVYEPRTQVFIGWRVAPRPYYVGERNGTRTRTPRGEMVGRGAEGDEPRSTRTARRGGGDDNGKRGGKTAEGRTKSGDDDEDDDDEEETSLRLPALGAVAAVGLVAYAGGTVGLYGRGDTPLGLAAGYTRPGGGLQLHAAVNDAVLSDDSGQKLTMKALGFYDVFSSPIQPAVGLGLQVDPQHEGGARPSASLGLAGNFGRIVLFGGVDVVQTTPEIGLAYNFRYSRRGTSEGSEGAGP